MKKKVEDFFKKNPNTLAFYGAIFISVCIELLLNIDEISNDFTVKQYIEFIAKIIMIVTSFSSSVILLNCQNIASHLQENYEIWKIGRKNNPCSPYTWSEYLKQCDTISKSPNNESSKKTGDNHLVGDCSFNRLSRHFRWYQVAKVLFIITIVLYFIVRVLGKLIPFLQ